MTGSELKIETRWIGQNTVAYVIARVGDDVLFANKVDVAKASARERFAQDLTKDRPGVDPAAVEASKAELLKSLDARSKELSEKGSDQKQNLTDLLVALASDLELFHDADQTAYVSIGIDGHHETWPVRSRQFRHWLRWRLRAEQERSTYAEALQAAIDEIDSRALYDGPHAHAHVHVHVRLAWHDDALWLDLADDQWRAVRVDGKGWKIVEEPPVRFVRPNGMLALPDPVSGGSIDDLRPFVNVANETDFVLVVALIIGALQPPDRRRDYPVANIVAEHGTGKSLLAAACKSLVDPSSCPLRSTPRDLRDLAIAADHSWLLAFDNLSRLQPWLSDGLCRLSTGGGFATRTLYSNREEEIFAAQRPVILNGIGDVATRPDLADRCVNITLAPLPDNRRRKKTELRADFEAVRPRLLGAILDAVACAIHREGQVQMDALPRMTDFATWMVAAEPELGWQPGTFMAAYTADRQAANMAAIESSPIGPVILRFLDQLVDGQWRGTACQLLDKLKEVAGDKAAERDGWPKSPRGLSEALRRIAPNLRHEGIRVEMGKRDTTRTRWRLIVLEKGAPQPSTSSGPSEMPPDGPETHLAPDGPGRSADGCGRLREADRPAETPPGDVSGPLSDGADGADGVAGGSAEKELFMDKVTPGWPTYGAP